MTTCQMRRHCKLDSDGQQLMEMVTDRLGYSARTIADLAEAIQYRSLDRKTL